MDKSLKMCGPSITQHEINKINQMMIDGWESYQYVEEFEERFANWHGRKYCLMTPCCTHAIHLGLLAIGVNKSHEVIAPESTWTGSVAPIIYCDATPIFADVDIDSWCLENNTIESLITNKTKAIIAVDLYGSMPDYKKLEEICAKKNIVLIEDAAEALGSYQSGKAAGSFGLFSVHSFHRTKTITTGEGGALLTDDKDFYLQCKFLRDHGRSNTKAYFIEKAAPKYMPSNLIGALACAQLDRINDLLAIKKRIRDDYQHFLQINSIDCKINADSEVLINGSWATTIILKNEIEYSELEKKLKSFGIPIRPFFYPLTCMPGYSKYKLSHNCETSNSSYLSKNGLTLPSHYDTSTEDIEKICSVLKSVL